MLATNLALALVRGRPWHHAFEILPGVRTEGTYDPSPLWNALGLPDDMASMSLADVGASNGFFSFEARKRGAHVVAFDFRHKDNSGFGMAQYINGMADIEHHQVNVLDMTREEFGEFDVVLALGLLYHVADPYRALANCAALSKERLYVESYCIDSLLDPALREQPIMRFIPDPVRFPELGSIGNDRSNFWGFTSICLRRMVEDLGFEVRWLSVQHDRVLLEARRRPAESQNTRLWLAYAKMPAMPVTGDKNDPECWTLF